MADITGQSTLEYKINKIKYTKKDGTISEYPVRFKYRYVKVKKVAITDEHTALFKELAKVTRKGVMHGKLSMKDITDILQFAKDRITDNETDGSTDGSTDDEVAEIDENES
jgi:hypothetical protein